MRSAVHGVSRARCALLVRAWTGGDDGGGGGGERGRPWPGPPPPGRRRGPEDGLRRMPPGRRTTVHAPVAAESATGGASGARLARWCWRGGGAGGVPGVLGTEPLGLPDCRRDSPSTAPWGSVGPGSDGHVRGAVMTQRRERGVSRVAGRAGAAAVAAAAGTGTGTGGGDGAAGAAGGGARGSGHPRPAPRIDGSPKGRHHREDPIMAAIRRALMANCFAAAQRGRVVRVGAGSGGGWRNARPSRAHARISVFMGPAIWRRNQPNQVFCFRVATSPRARKLQTKSRDCPKNFPDGKKTFLIFIRLVLIRHVFSFCTGRISVRLRT